MNRNMTLLHGVHFFLCFYAFVPLWLHAQVPITNTDKAEIRYLAQKKIENDLRGLYNTIAFDGASEFQITKVIQNSFMAGTDQIFYNDAVIVEDDISPENTQTAKGTDKLVSRYLMDMSLFYAKADTESIFFTEISPTKVEIGKAGYPFVKVYFKSSFRGIHKNKKPYTPVVRIAELRAERESGKWRVYITGIRFYKETKGTDLPKPAPLPSTAPLLRAKKPETIKPDTSVVVANAKTESKAITIPIQTTKKGQTAKILTALVGVGAGYFAYKNYQNWQSKLKELNFVTSYTDPTNSGIIRSPYSFSTWQNAYNDAKSAQTKQTSINVAIGVAVVAAIAEIVLIVKKPKTQPKPLSLAPAEMGLGLAIKYKL